jgi:hypothetical protein
MATTPDPATLEIPGKELGGLADLIEHELGRQEARTQELTVEDREALTDMFKALIGAMSDMWHDEERRGAPFRVGERVELVPEYEWMLNFDTRLGATVISQNAEDPRHASAWCVVRLDHGTEVELAAFQVRRPADPS